MEHDPHQNFYRCPNECGEFWPQEFNLRAMFYEEVEEKGRLSRKKGSGSRGRKRKKKRRCLSFMVTLSKQLA